MSRKIKELLKSLAIVALMFNSVFLAYKSEVFNEFLSEAKLPERLAAYFGNGEQAGNSGSNDAENSEFDVVAKPVIMAVIGDVGARYGAKSDEAQLNSVYENTVNIVGEALGSARLPEACSEEEWREALGRPGIYWDYKVELPINSLIKWLGMSTLNDNSDYADRFAVVIGEHGGVDVYYANSNGYRKCGTAAAADSIGGVTQAFLPNGAYFAFESEKVGDLIAPYTLILPEMSEKYIVGAENIIENEPVIERTAELLGISILGGTSYAEKNGTMVYVGVNGIMRIMTDGELNYSVTDYDYSETEEETKTDDGQLIEQAYQLITDIRSNYSGIEDIYFAGIEKSGNGRVSVRFNYYIDGTEVVQRRGDGATVAYENGRMVSVDIWLHRYTATDEKANLLPELQAAAIAGGLEKNGSLNLVYYDDGSAAVKPVWTVE